MTLVVKHPERSDPRFAEAPATSRGYLAAGAVVVLGLVGAAIARLILAGASWESDGDTPRGVVVATVIVFAALPLALSLIVTASGLALDRPLRRARGLRWASAGLLVAAVMPFDDAVGPLGFAINAALLVGAGLLIRRGHRDGTSPWAAQSDYC